MSLVSPDEHPIPVRIIAVTADMKPCPECRKYGTHSYACLNKEKH